MNDDRKPDAATGAGLGDLLKETFVRGTLSDEENTLTRDHHLGRAGGRPITGELDKAVDAPGHSGLRDSATTRSR